MKSLRTAEARRLLYIGPRFESLGLVPDRWTDPAGRFFVERHPSGAWRIAAGVVMPELGLNPEDELCVDTRTLFRLLERVLGGRAAA